MIFNCQFFSRSKSNRIKYQRGNSKTLFSSNRYLFMIFLKHQRFYFFFNLWICNHINKVFTFCSATYISNCTFFPIPYIRVFPDFSDRYISTCFMYLLSWNASLAAIAIIISWIKILPTVLPFEILSYIPNKHTHRLSHYDIHLISNSTKSLWLHWHFIYWLILA